jgi:murein endopeptidase
MTLSHTLALTALATLASASAYADPPDARSPWRASWRGARHSASNPASLGAPNQGTLRRGKRLPVAGSGFTRRERGHHYGTAETIALIRFAGARLVEAYPQTASLLVGDISRREGGRLSPHRSHQSGRDVDIALPELTNARLRSFNARLKGSQVDFEKLWFVLDTLVASDRVQFVFLDQRLLKPLHAQARLAGWSRQDLGHLFSLDGARRGVIRHAPGHTCHMHIRFHCPEGSPGCDP